MIEDQDNREGIINAFQSFLTEQMEWRADIGGLPFNSLSEEEAGILEMPFRAEEVQIALNELNGDIRPRAQMASLLLFGTLLGSLLRRS